MRWKELKKVVSVLSKSANFFKPNNGELLHDNFLLYSAMGTKKETEINQPLLVL
tara:strand:+ start:1070 stop:1231 length:162 start_codon:yes stop_codon:yes gene_type:complete